MKAGDITQFTEGMEFLKTCYPNLRDSDDEWSSRISGYYTKLSEFELVDVRAGIMASPNEDCYPGWFPTVGQLQRLVIEQGRRRRQRDNQTESARRSAEQSELPWDLRVPTKDTTQKVYVDEADKPGERLARKWECDSVNLGLTPGSPTPAHTVPERLAEFWEWFGGKEF